MFFIESILIQYISTVTQNKSSVIWYYGLNFDFINITHCSISILTIGKTSEKLRCQQLKTMTNRNWFTVFCSLGHFSQKFKSRSIKRKIWYLNFSKTYLLHHQAPDKKLQGYRASKQPRFNFGSFLWLVHWVSEQPSGLVQNPRANPRPL